MIIAATGHRPKYCPCKYNEKHPWLKDLKNRLYADLDVGYNSGQISKLLTSIHIGWGFWISEVAIEIGIPIHAIILNKGEESMWSKADIDRYNYILSKCEKSHILSTSYVFDSYKKRDDSILKDSDMLMLLADPHSEDRSLDYIINQAKYKKIKIENYWK